MVAGVAAQQVLAAAQQARVRVADQVQDPPLEDQDQDQGRKRRPEEEAKRILVTAVVAQLTVAPVRKHIRYRVDSRRASLLEASDVLALRS